MIELTRKKGYKDRLSVLINSKSNKSFIWGVRDCMLFVADAVKAATGEDIAEKIRGTYYDERGGNNEVLRLSPSGCYVEYMEQIFSNYTGVIENDTTVGSVCIISLFGKQFGGVVLETGVAIFQPGGVKLVKLKHIDKSWGYRWQL